MPLTVRCQGDRLSPALKSALKAIGRPADRVELAYPVVGGMMTVVTDAFFVEGRGIVAAVKGISGVEIL